MLNYCHCNIKVKEPKFIEVLRGMNLSFACTVLNTITKPRNTLFISQTSDSTSQVFFVLNYGYT